MTSRLNRMSYSQTHCCNWPTAPKRLKVIKAKSGADRESCHSQGQWGGGQVLMGVSAEEGAQATLKLLIEEGVVR